MASAGFPLNPMQGNPSGFNMFGGGRGSGAPTPNFSLFGNPTSSKNLSSMIPGFSATFGNFNPLQSPVASSLPSTGIFGASMPNFDPNRFQREMSNAFGKAYGPLLMNAILGGGGFNPAVAQAQMAAMYPGLIRSQNDLLTAFGAEGGRFSSGAALGMGDLLSNFNLGQSQIFANEYEQGVSNILQLMSSVAPTLHAEQANQGSIFDKIAGGLEIAAGIAGAPFTGGASLPLVGSGVSTLSAGFGGGGGAGAGSTGNVPNFGGFQSLFKGSTAPPIDPTVLSSLPLQQANLNLGGSAADILQGGSGDIAGMYPGLIQPGLIQ